MTKQQRIEELEKKLSKAVEEKEGLQKSTDEWEVFVNGIKKVLKGRIVDQENSYGYPRSFGSVQQNDSHYENVTAEIAHIKALLDDRTIALNDLRKRYWHLIRVGLKDETLITEQTIEEEKRKIHHCPTCGRG